MKELFENNPIFLLFIVAALGYLVGSIKIKGNSLGVAAVLFVGLAIGAINPNYNVPQIIFDLGLVLFVYSIGLKSGPAFFMSFRKNGAKNVGFVLLMLTISAGLAVALYYLLGLDKATITGIYAGSSTNTPALASVIDLVNKGSGYADKSTLQEHLVIGYTYSYPMGVLGVMVAIKIMEKIMKVDYHQEKISLKKTYPVYDEIITASALITKKQATGKQVRDLVQEENWTVIFGRNKRKDGHIGLTSYDSVFAEGDEIMIVGDREEVDRVIEYLGEPGTDSIFYDRKEYDVRRIFVSNPKVVGQKLSALNLSEKFNCVVTRIRRGDADMLAKAGTILEQGDRIRFVARRKDLKELSTYFGDSYYESSRVNLFSFGLGIAIGLLLGSITFHLPGNIDFNLGLAGGPLVVGLILGAWRRTGPLVWTLPYGANVTLSQLGLILLLAVVGLKSGNTFIQSLDSGTGLVIFLGGTIIATMSACLSLLIGYKLFKIPFSLLLGFVSNQPAILDFAIETSKNRIPMIGYSLMFPIALIIKILYAQLLFLLLA